MLTAGLSCTIQVFDFPQGRDNHNLRPAKARPSAEPYAMPRELAPPVFVISTFKIAESMAFKGDYRQWEHLLRVHE